MFMNRFFLLPGKGWLAILLLILMGGCTKEQESVIPYVKVDFYLNLATYNNLIIPGNSQYFPVEGVSGVIVMCVNQMQYYAFDAACPYEANGICKVEADASTIGQCECCGSEYSLFGGGYPTSGPTTENLKQYRVDLVGGRLWIHN